MLNLGGDIISFLFRISAARSSWTFPQLQENASSKPSLKHLKSLIKSLKSFNDLNASGEKWETDMTT